MTGAEAVKARLFLVLLTLGWGVTWVTMKIALTEIPPFSMRVGTLSVGALTLIAIAWTQGWGLKIPRGRTWLHVVAAATLNIAAFSVFTPFAQLRSDTSRVAIVVYTMPIWASLLARPVLGERLTPIRMAALALCAAGMAILIFPLAQMGIPAGILLALGAALSWAGGTVYLKWAKLDGDPMAITFWQLIAGLLMIAALLPLFEGSLQLHDAHLTPMLAMVFSGFVGSGICYFLWFDTVRRLPATVASLGILSVPAVGVLSSVVILGECPTLPDIVGFALMFAASACVMLWPQDAACARQEVA